MAETEFLLRGKKWDSLLREFVPAWTAEEVQGGQRWLVLHP